MQDEPKRIYDEADQDFLCPLCGASSQCEHTMPEMVVATMYGDIPYDDLWEGQKALPGLVVKTTGRFMFRGEPVPIPPLGQVRKLDD